jgi:hypothetical protein
MGFDKFHVYAELRVTKTVIKQKIQNNLQRESDHKFADFLIKFNITKSCNVSNVLMLRRQIVDCSNFSFN